MSPLTANRRRITIALVILLGVTAGALTASPRPGPLGSGDLTGPRADGSAAGSPNATDQHTNPETVEGDGNLDQLRSRFSAQLASKLKQCSPDATSREGNQPPERVCEKYNESIQRYGSLTNESTASASFTTARRQRRAFVSAVRRYRATHRAYEEARADGNETRARTLARNLSRTAERIRRLNRSLTETYRSISTRTGVNFSGELAAIHGTTRNVTARQQTVVAATFVRTRISVTPEGERVAFTDPLGIRGRVTTANGTPVTAGNATILVGNRTYHVALGSDGRFRLSYRPVGLPLNRSRVRVRYRPPNASRYRRARTTVPVDVARSTPDVSVSLNRTTAGYGDVVRVTVTVDANGTRVPDLPVTLALGSRLLGTNATGTSGTITRAVRIGVDTQPGVRSVRASTGAEGRAIAPANASTRLEVVETPTTVSLDGQVEGDRVVLSGRLVTADGRGVPDQRITLAVAEGRAVSVTTNATGHFRTSVPAGSVAPGEDDTIEAVYRGASTNLAGARATATVRLDDRGIAHRVTGGRPVLLGLGMGAVVLGAGGWVAARRRRGGKPPVEADGTETDATTRTRSSGRPDRETLRRAVDRARSEHEAGDSSGAIEHLYPAVRQFLAASADLPETGTHWEFSRAVVDEPAAEDWAPVVRSLTEAYERVRFAESTVDDGDVEALLDRLADRLEDRPTEGEP